MAGAPKGNNNAGKGARLSKVLKKRLEERAKESELIDVLINKALEGDLAAIKEVFDRIDGKPKQSIDMSAEVTQKNIKELTDDELAAIAAGSS